MSAHRLSYPCRFKKREDGSYFIRFPDIPEAMVDSVDEVGAQRAAEECLASVLYWRITNEIDIPPPSRLRPDQQLISLGRAQALSDAIAQTRPLLTVPDDLYEIPALDGALARHEQPRLSGGAPSGRDFGPIAAQRA